jgi:hypothetical protein
MNADFLVADIFDLPGRTFLVAVGRVVTGVISQGDVLTDSGGREFRVAGIEFACRPGSPPRDDDRITLLFCRDRAAHLRSGVHLKKAV